MTERILCLLVAAFFYMQGPALAVPGAGEVARGNEAYFKGKFNEAADHYEAAASRSPNDPRIDYDLGAAAYKTGKYMDAVGFLNKALLADDKKLQDDVQYNLANALYKAGVDKEEKDIKGAIKNVEESLVHYDKILASAEGKHDDAKENRVFVAAELERLKKKQQEQKENNKQSQQQRDQDQSQKDQSQQQKDQSQQQKDQGQQGQQQQAKSQEEQKAEESKAEENKKAEEKKPEGQKPGDEQKKPEGQKADDKNGPGDQGASSGQSEQGHILSQDEANMLLDDFAQNEQPKGMLNFVREPRQERPVSKDW